MTSVVRLLSTPIEKRTPDDLIQMLRCASKLEHATLPPYLTAWWSIKDKKNPAHEILRSVVFEEMGHLGIVCNLLKAIGSTPNLTDPDFVPKYPSPLPCSIAPKVTPPNVIDWQIGLSRLTPAIVSDVFMIIEYPEKGPVQVMEMLDAATASRGNRPRYHTIGQFYDAIAKTLEFLVNDAKTVKICGDGQLCEPFTGHDEGGQNVVKPITNLADALTAIRHIKEQGEGTPCSPDAPMFGHELAHYYRFKEIQVGRLFAQQPDKSWTLSGALFDFPQVRPMADIPADGYSGSGVPQPVVDRLSKFNSDYKNVLTFLQSAWEKAGPQGQTDLEAAKSLMLDLGDTAIGLMETPIDPKKPALGNYGPTFRIP